MRNIKSCKEGELKRNCKTCAKEFLYLPYQTQGKYKKLYCSKPCQHIGTRTKVTVVCKCCRKIFTTFPSKIKNGGGKFCSISCGLKGHQRGRGRKVSKETREKLRLAHSGYRSYWWRGGVTAKNKLIRSSKEYRNWRKSVFERDAYTCLFCSSKSQKGNPVYIEADHIKPFSDYPELRFEISNGRTLCKPCHKTTDTYGPKNRWKVKK